MGRKGKRPLTLNTCPPILDHEMSDIIGQSTPPKHPPKLIKAAIHQPEIVFCSTCSAEIDLKPQVIHSADNAQPLDPLPPTTATGQISLGTLCAQFGLGQDFIMGSRKDYVDMKTSCHFCWDCFTIVEEVQELKHHIELLRVDMTSRMVTLKSRLHESRSLRLSEHKRGRPRHNVATLNKIQKVLSKAFGPGI